MMHNAGGKKHERTKVHVACGNRNQQLFVVDIFLYCFFFCSIEAVAASCFFMHLGFFLPLQPVLAVKFPSITRFHSPLPHSQG